MSSSPFETWFQTILVPQNKDLATAVARVNDAIYAAKHIVKNAEIGEDAVLDVAIIVLNEFARAEEAL